MTILLYLDLRRQIGLGHKIGMSTVAYKNKSYIRVTTKKIKYSLTQYSPNIYNLSPCSSPSTVALSLSESTSTSMGSVLRARRASSLVLLSLVALNSMVCLRSGGNDR